MGREKEISYLLIIQDLLTNLCGDNSIGVEIGTHKAYSSRSMLECKNIDKLFLVDPYKQFPANYDVYDDKSSQSKWNKVLKKAKRRLQPYKGRYKFIRSTSSKSSRIIQDDLDFVFIDGNHKYSFVRDDVASWFPKLKPGGLCFGHDWVDKSHHMHSALNGLVQAVVEFFDSHASDIKHNVLVNTLQYTYKKYQGGLYLSPITNGGIRIWWAIKK